MPMFRLPLLLVALSFTWPGAAMAASFSAEPYKTVPMEPARVAVESVSINNWLAANLSRLPPDRTQRVREHLHALIDSRVKELQAQNGVLLPKTPDTLLAMLYSWAGRLGVFGSDAVYAALRTSKSDDIPPGPPPPAGFDIVLNGDTLVVSSTPGGWQASVPFHFFIFALQGGPVTSGQRGEALVVAMGTAPDAAPPGYSQATLAVFYTEGADAKSFEQQWLARLEIPAGAPTALPGQSRYASRTAFDEATRLHKEAVFVTSGKGSFAILYSGLDGTYQVNRPHFLDFMRELRITD